MSFAAAQNPMSLSNRGQMPHPKNWLQQLSWPPLMLLIFSLLFPHTVVFQRIVIKLAVALSINQQHGQLN